MVGAKKGGAKRIGKTFPEEWRNGAKAGGKLVCVGESSKVPSGRLKRKRVAGGVVPPTPQERRRAKALSSRQKIRRGGSGSNTKKPAEDGGRGIGKPSGFETGRSGK